MIKKILLHICCGGCASWPIDLLKEKYDKKEDNEKENKVEIIGYFYNPCIQPREEYEKRLKSAEKVIKAKGERVSLIVGEDGSEEGYELEMGKWLGLIKGLENEPEGGKRCEICFRMRLEKSARTAKELGANCFTTTLTLGPQKKSAVINKIGQKVAEEYGLEFLEFDFKKKDGFKKSLEQSKELGIYRQNYCGCLFSLTKNIASPRE